MSRCFVICGCRSEALIVFNRLYERDVISWTTLMEDFVDPMEFQYALHAYKHMIGDSLVFSKYTRVAELQVGAGRNTWIWDMKFMPKP